MFPTRQWPQTLTLSSERLGVYCCPCSKEGSCHGAVAAYMTALAPSLVGACRFLMNQRIGLGRRELAYILEETAPGSTAQDCTKSEIA